MTFTENLESAKNGNKRSYGMLCNEFADRLYTVAFLVLNTETDAEEAVKNAFDDGFGGIGRINDTNHLCAWLSRELTKHIVAKLKEYRAENKAVSGGNIPEKEAFCCLNDLDRLVCALNLAFGYKTKEISVITGLKEETVERKTNDSVKKLGKNIPLVSSFFEKSKAPDSLITKMPKVHDLTVEIDHSDDDELIGEMERIAAFAEAEENKLNSAHGLSREEITEIPPQEEKKPEEKPANPKLIRFQPVQLEEDKPEEKNEPEPKAEQAEALVPEIKAEPVVPEEKNIAEPVHIEKTPGPERVKEAPAPKQENAPRKEIDAKTFINVITAQKIKGSEFLKLMGNTRISNSVYREIEQNPGLTKDRLVELLEQSPLTSEDYVKILTAVKQRNEMLSKKEEAQRKQEQAGLFSINKREENPKPAPEPVLTDTRAFAANDFEAANPVTPAKPAVKVPEPVPQAGKPKPEPVNVDEDKPFAPKIEIETDEAPDDEPFDPFEKKRSSAPVPKREEEPERDEPETGRREKYRGREYFIDDDVYYPGVNNGKIIFCAVCAVLLIAGSFGIRYLTTGSLLPTDNPSSVINNTVEEKLPAEYLSNDDIYEAISKLETVFANKESGYYKADGKAYSEVLTKDFCESGDMVYILNDGKILKYDLTAKNPYLFTEFAIDETREFLGFSAAEDKIYLLYANKYSETVPYTVTSTAEDGTVTTQELSKDIERSRVTAECYDSSFNLLNTYSQDGDFAAVKADAESITVATSLNTAKTAVKEAGATFLPSYSVDGAKMLVNFDSITVPDGISYNSFTVIGTVSGGEARVNAILGGSDGYVEFKNDECKVVIPDKNKTFSETFRFIGSNLSAVASESYTGECYGTEFINETGDVITAYDSENKCTLVQKKNGEEYVTVSGIGAYETLTGVAYTDKYAYIVTETAEKSSMLYCVDISGTELIAAEADPNAVYTEKLKAYGDELIGMTVEANESGERTGLKLAVYGYENGLKENRSVTITMDENTSSEYLRYLSADAEISNLRIAADETNTFAAVSTVYFDGISEIERILCYKDNGTELNMTGELLLFDIQSDYRFLAIRGNILYIITDSSVITVDAESGDPMGYFNESSSTSAETEEAAIE